MVEVLKHLLGCCGENHPNLFYLLYGNAYIKADY